MALSRPATLLLVALACLPLALPLADRAPLAPEREEGGPYPSDWFGAQRAFPYDSIPQATFQAAVEQAVVERAVVGHAAQQLGATSSLLTWQQAGPYNIGGRVTALAVAPGGATVYLGAANGGVFKSVDSGVHWTPVFDLFGVYSIGALALHPFDPDTVYCGTGEANASVDSYDGAGLYRSADGGETWTGLGLRETARIARVAVDPSNPRRVFVAAMGTQFSTGPHRGLYRSENGGATWSKVLFVNDSTGCADVVVNPAHPETVYCATWERIRRPTYRRAYGPGCGIWRSVNSGTTWTRLATGLPAPSDAVGRIGLAIAPSRPSAVYAQIIAGVSGGYNGLGLYRTVDGGGTWTRRDASGFTDIFGGFGWYFGDVAVDPVDSDRVYALGVALARSLNGGIDFSSDLAAAAHVDQHAIWIDPANPSRIYLGNDGGFYWSPDGGSTWQKSVDLPITQFYAGAIDPSNPSRLLGGTQDNETLITSGSPGGWNPILGGDGFYCLVDPTNPQVIFAEWQNCCSRSGIRRSTNGGSGWTTASGFSGSDRYNWNTPFVMDPGNHNVLLVGSQRVYKSTNNGVSFVAVSGDLTSNPPASLVYGTITTLAISPLSPRIYFAGTDDGRVWRSMNGGSSWTNVSAGLPLRYVTRVTADPRDSLTVYVTLSGFGVDEHLARVHRSTNAGDTWVSIAGNLPDVPANDILVDPVLAQTLYLASDIGVYATRNGGGSWYAVGQGMPIQTVFDLTLHPASRTLVAATHGRSQWRLNLNEMPVAVGPALAPGRLALSSPAPNPTRGGARFILEMTEGVPVEVAVFDAAGRRVRTLLKGNPGAGRHSLVWDGLDAGGRRAAAGVYFVRAAAADAVQAKRLVRVD